MKTIETNDYQVRKEVKGYCILKKQITKKYDIIHFKKILVEDWLYLGEDFEIACTWTTDGFVVDKNPIKYYEDKETALKYLNRLNAGSVFVA